MRHFKYPFQKNIERNLYKKRVALYSEKEKRIHRFRTIFTIIDIGIFFASIFVMSWITSYVARSDIFIVFRVIICLILCLLILVVPVAISVLLFIVVDNLFPYIPLPEVRKQMIDECMVPLKQYYKLTDSFIITKCYESTNEKLINRDLILFPYEDKLRIVNDFTRSTKDFGCYEFSLEDIELNYGKKENLITTVIKSKKVTLILGKRAKPFIVKKVFSGGIEK